jgi:hypothetical protein
MKKAGKPKIAQHSMKNALPRPEGAPGTCPPSSGNHSQDAAARIHQTPVSAEQPNFEPPARCRKSERAAIKAINDGISKVTRIAVRNANRFKVKLMAAASRNMV